MYLIRYSCIIGAESEVLRQRGSYSHHSCAYRSGNPTPTPRPSHSTSSQPHSRTAHTQRLSCPGRNHNLTLARAQIVVTFDTATRHRFLRTALSPCDPPLQQIPLLAVHPHPLIALVLRSHRGNDAWWGVPPLSKHPRIASAEIHHSSVHIRNTHSCGIVRPSAPRNLSSVAWLQRFLSR
jgi:hypothetical protein